MFLYCYSSVTSAVFQLMNCTSVCSNHNNECQDVLFYAGNEDCDFAGWQFVLILLFVLVLLPVIPVLVWVLKSLPSSWKISSYVTSLGIRIASTSVFKAMKLSPIAEASRASATAPYKPRHWHWAALLVLQRLGMVSIGVFFEEGVETSVGMMCISAWFLMFQ
jgi:hypothetical protein